MKKEFIDSFGNTADRTVGSAIGPLPDPSFDPNVRHLPFPSTGAQVIPEGPTICVWELGPQDVVIRTLQEVGTGRTLYYVKRPQKETPCGNNNPLNDPYEVWKRNGCPAPNRPDANNCREEFQKRYAQELGAAQRKEGR